MPLNAIKCFYLFHITALHSFLLIFFLMSLLLSSFIQAVPHVIKVRARAHTHAAKHTHTHTHLAIALSSHNSERKRTRNVADQPQLSRVLDACTVCSDSYGALQVKSTVTALYDKTHNRTDNLRWVTSSVRKMRRVRGFPFFVFFQSRYYILSF